MIDRFISICFWASGTWLAIALFFAILPDSQPKPNYEMQANCIAEYDYQHPERPMMDNLIIALQRCQR